MNTATNKRIDLSATARSLHARMKESDAGPTLIAQEVVALSRSWEDPQWTAEHGVEGQEFNDWLRATFGPGRGLAFFLRRAKAVEVLSRSVAERLHHAAAVWVAQSVPEAFRLPMCSKISETYRSNKSSCVTLQQVVYLYSGMCPKEPKKAETRECPNCALLRAEIAALKEEQIDWGGPPAEHIS